MDISKLIMRVEELKDLSCKSCTKDCLQNHDILSFPIE